MIIQRSKAMYLSNKQHSQLRTLVMNFEIPYRAFVAMEILKKYPTDIEFENAIVSKSSLSNVYASFSAFSSEFGKIKANAKYIYSLLKNVKNSIGQSVQKDEINIPFISQINILVLIFNELYQTYINRFFNTYSFWEKAGKFHYVRNKLAHPGCKTLEKTDLDLAVEFVDISNNFLRKNYESYYWLESAENIEKQATALSTSSFSIPIEINNFCEMPFSESKLVCREREIEELKKFVYGKKGVLRKKTSYCLFGYGGVGKTALVLETIKNIVRDVIDETTINSYSPSFILFFSAKKLELNVSSASGTIEQLEIKNSFFDFETLKKSIFSYLKIESFHNFDKAGLIIIDNYETLSQEERNKIREFIEYESPSQIQYIVTSRNEERFDERTCLSGFNDKESGKVFILEYLTENDINLQLSQKDIENLLDITKGNTLVLVLSIKRLEQKFDTILGLKADLTRVATVNKIGNELKTLPANGYEIISEYMFKNTFEELEKVFIDSSVTIYALLKILAVYPGDCVDIYTLSMLSKRSYQEIEPIMTMLCKYLIVEKKNNEYGLNEFAEKYIIFRFLPDKESYLSLSNEIENSTRQIKTELRNLQEQIENNTGLRHIILDWAIITEGDRIAAAKAYRLYGETRTDCRKGKFFVELAYEHIKQTFQEIERSTMHPYVKYQKARILRMLNDSNVLKEDLTAEIKNAYQECIWIIKTNTMYSAIRKTKTYASILWLFGMQLQVLNEDRFEVAKYLEESFETFNDLNIRDEEFYQCVSYMGRNYLEIYKETHAVTYLRQARKMSDILFNERHKYNSKVRGFASGLRNELKQYIPTLR